MRLAMTGGSVVKVSGWSAWTAKGGETGDFGGNSLEHPRRWLGAQWPGPHPGSTELPRATRRALPEEAQGASWGAAKGGTLTMTPRSHAGWKRGRPVGLWCACNHTRTYAVVIRGRACTNTPGDRGCNHV